MHVLAPLHTINVAVHNDLPTRFLSSTEPSLAECSIILSRMSFKKQLQSTTVVALLACPLCHGQESGKAFVDGGIYFKNLQLPEHAQIVSFTIHLEAGAFRSIGDIPRGWQVTIESSPSGSADLLLKSNSDQTAISESALDHLSIMVYQTVPLPDQPMITGEYVLSLGATGAKRRVPLSRFNFTFIQRYSRKRID